MLAKTVMIRADRSNKKQKRCKVMSTDLGYLLVPARDNNLEEFQEIDQWLAEEQEPEQLVQI